MPKTKQDIVESLLWEAGYYWYDDNEDTVSPIDPDTFDPAVDKIFKANAVEIEKLYAEIADSRKRIINGLSRTLVPDSSLLPVPGVTIGQVTSKFSRIEITPEDSFMISGQDDVGVQHDYYFTSLFNHEFPKASIKYMVSNSQVIDYMANPPMLIDNEVEVPFFKDTKHVWIGLDIHPNVEADDKLIFFLGNKMRNEFDRDTFAFYSASWSINGKQELPVSIGLEHFKENADSNLLHILNIPDSHERVIMTRFKDSFMTITKLPEDIDKLKQKYPPIDEAALLETLPGREDLLWIKLEFKLPIPNNFFTENPLQVNCIPLINRKLVTNHVVKANYDRILLPMPTQQHFLSVNKVWDELLEEQETGYQRVDLLNPTGQPGSYMIRSGESVRRFNRQDATKQIYRLLEVIQEEHNSFKEGGVSRLREDFNVIDKAINRIKEELYDEYYNKIVKTSYFAVANFRRNTYTLWYNYWETQAEAVNQLKDGIALEIRSVDRSGIKGKTIIPLQKGRGELRENDYINILKESILSRNSIVTKGDIEQYCLSRYASLVELKSIKHHLESRDGQFERVILVTLKLKPHQGTDKESKDFLTTQMQNELNAMTSFITPIKVTFI